MANLLLHESSPYLLQHAHNPVNWRAWNEESLALAREQKKLILVSIGYSACHWCHVMEKQCFENEEAARIMNKYFVCIKVDREERPDVDAVYMQALQLMNGQGGWPLNCFTLPDGRPVFGGTYFPLEKWISVLENLQHIYQTNLAAMEDYAARLTQGIQQTQLYKIPQDNDNDLSYMLKLLVEQWQKHFDQSDGGTQRVPKFPMPCNYLFLLFYGITYQHHDIIKHVKLTLDKMSMGGLFDQLGGGFARYSTDGIWKVPHFEKMLYDNAQLISLYSKAYQFWQDPNDSFVIEKSFEFILDSLTGPQGEFYSALDADSEGEEGKYYVWKIDELKQLLQADFDLFGRYFNINQTGYWEHDHYILIRTEKDEQFCDIHHLQYSDFLAKKNKWMSILLNARKERIAPGLDDKTLTSWNALMLKACLDAYISIGRQVFLDAAIKNADFILNHQLQQSSALYHTFKNGKSAINGFLEDYALLADAFVMLYKVTGNDTWLTKARDLADYALKYFYDPADGLFYFNSNDDKPLIARQKEVQDNVIPSSNAVMAHVLFDLSIYFENNSYRDTSAKMLAHFYDEMISYGSAYSCWAMLMLKFEAPVLQVAIPVKDFKEAAQHVLKSKHINLYTYCNTAVSCLPFIADKMHSANYYLCTNNVCGLPLNNQNELISAIEKV
jgi:hypothetical protein